MSDLDCIPPLARDSQPGYSRNSLGTHQQGFDKVLGEIQINSNRRKEGMYNHSVRIAADINSKKKNSILVQTNISLRKNQSINCIPPNKRPGAY